MRKQQAEVSANAFLVRILHLPIVPDSVNSGGL